METKNLSKLIGSGESMAIEWKPSLSQINEIIESITALKYRRRPSFCRDF